MVSQQIQFLESQMRAPAPPPAVAAADTSKASAPDKTQAEPGAGGIPGLAPDTALKGQSQLAPANKKS
jgi:hypothetical protein